MALRLYFSLLAAASWLPEPLVHCYRDKQFLSTGRKTHRDWRTPHRRKRNPRPGLDTHRGAPAERVPTPIRAEFSRALSNPRYPCHRWPSEKEAHGGQDYKQPRGKWRHEAMQHCNISLSQPLLSELRSGRLIQKSKAL